MSNTANELKSRWGYHPCSFEVFQKLRFLHRCYWQTVYDFHRWHRWWRKEEQNRVGPEPKFCPYFVDNRTWFKPVRVRGEQGFKVYPRTVTDWGLLELYHQARTPQPEPVDPFDEQTLNTIERHYLGVPEYFD